MSNEKVLRPRMEEMIRLIRRKTRNPFVLEDLRSIESRMDALYDSAKWRPLGIPSYWEHAANTDYNALIHLKAMVT